MEENRIRPLASACKGPAYNLASSRLGLNGCYIDFDELVHQVFLEGDYSSWQFFRLLREGLILCFSKAKICVLDTKNESLSMSSGYFTDKIIEKNSIIFLGESMPVETFLPEATKVEIQTGTLSYAAPVRTGQHLFEVVKKYPLDKYLMSH